MEHEKKTCIASLKNEENELLIEDVWGSTDLSTLENEVLDSQIPRYQYDDKGVIIEEKIKDLIKTIQCYPSLYDSTHPDYQNSEKKSRTWEAVAKQAKFSSVQEAQRKWKNVREYYKRALENQTDNPTPDVFGRKQWAYINEMKFMENILKKIKKRSYHSSDSEEVHDTSSSNEPFERHLKSVENTNKMIMNYLQKKMKDTDEKRDSLAVFFQSMEGLVRTFSKARQLEVKCKLSAVILGAEAAEMKERLGMSDDNAVPVNFSTPGSSSNVYLNNANMHNMPFQNPNVYPSCSTQPYPPPQNYTSKVFSHQFAALQAQTVQFHQRMSRPNKQ